jgi:hypothetical protein
MSSLQDFPIVKNEEKEFYIYKWDFEFYDEDDSSNKIYPSKVLMMRKDSNYKKLTSPTFLAQMRFTNADMVRLRLIQKRCLCTITCKSIIYNPTNGEGASNSYKLVDSKIEFSTTFVPVFDENTFREGKYNDDETLEKEEKEANNTTDSNQQAVLDSPTQMAFISFFNLASIRMNKILYNAVIDKGTTTGSIIQWICSETEAEGFIIDDPMNMNETPEVIIPPMTFVPAINYIQEMYGVYENGIQIFMDYDNILYILDKYADEHDRKEGDSAVTHIYSADIDKSEAMTTTRSLNDSKEAMYVGTPKIDILDDEIMEGELKGDNFVFSSFNQSIDAIGYDTKNKPVSSTVKEVSMTLKRDTETHAATGERTVVDYDELNNVFNMASKFNEVEAQAQKISIVLQNVNINDFTVNKFIELHFQNTDKNNKLGGVYYLNGVYFSFKELPSAEINLTSVDVDDTTHEIIKTNCNCVLSLSRRNPENKA